MVERLLLDRIDTEAGAPSIGIQNHLIILDFANEAKTSVPFLHRAVSWAQIADDSIGRRIAMPPFRNVRLRHIDRFLSKFRLTTKIHFRFGMG